MDNTDVDQPSPPQSVHVSEDESLGGPQYASTEGEQLRDMEDFSSHQYATKSLREAVLQSSRYFFSPYEIKTLLENEQVEVDEKGWDGRTALSLAIENSLYDAVVLLLKKGADPNTREDRNCTPFFWAVTGSQCASIYGVCYDGMIGFLLQAGADPSLTDDYGNTPLALAAAIGNTEFVKLVVESGLAKINTQGDEEKTPLMRAATGGWPNCMRYLLPHPADMGSCAWWERLLQIRSRQREKEPGQFQLKDLYKMVDRTGLGDLISQLQKNSVLNTNLPDGRTFLSWAVEFEDVEVVIRLLNSEADPNIRDETEHQMTPLLKALKIGSMAMVDLLKEKDKYSMHILVEEADDMGEEEALELARKLLREGYDLNKRNLKGQNPVHIACRKGRKRFVEEFLHPDYEDQNAFVHYKDNSGKTPLRYAIDNEDIVNLLVEHGADLSDVETASLFKLGEPKPLCVQLTSTRAPNQTLLLISDYDEARKLWNPEFGVPQLREMEHEPAFGYISTLSNAEVPKDHGELLRKLMTEVALEWRKRVPVLADEINNIRLDQVELEGRSRTVLKRLQRKAGQPAKLRSWLKSHITGLTHVVDVDSYLRNEQHGDQKGPLRKIIWEMDQEVSSGLAVIEQNIRESLQIEIAWISISEATSIKRLTWVTVSQFKPTGSQTDSQVHISPPYVHVEPLRDEYKPSERQSRLEMVPSNCGIVDTFDLRFMVAL
ncbi:hypothetical protein IFM46972_08072 [Aspergillus udagawae]|uniref:Uncharacterized protein n=1 Tax=Aspergillus udagawae TaxID=91492 RepID=A0A8H3P6J4_9EURO|nr:hypothetical protein IFM46972_08072 [Aspergillus udagawae]